MMTKKQNPAVHGGSIKILGKNILLKPVSPADKTHSGIVLPQTANDVQWRKNTEAEVAAIGSGIQESLEYRKGSRVFVAMYEAKPFTRCGVDYLIAPQSAVVGIAVGNGSFYPVGSRILLKPIKTMNPKTVIFRPGAYERDDGEILFAQVHLVGSGIRKKDGTLRPFEVNPGDYVITSANAGRDVEAIEGTYKLVEQQDIEAIYGQKN